MAWGAEARLDDGHLWLPLRVSSDVSGTMIVTQLVDQARALNAVTPGGDLPAPGRV